MSDGVAFFTRVYVPFSQSNAFWDIAPIKSDWGASSRFRRSEVYNMRPSPLRNYCVPSPAPFPDERLQELNIWLQMSYILALRSNKPAIEETLRIVYFKPVLQHIQSARAV